MVHRPGGRAHRRRAQGPAPLRGRALGPRGGGRHGGPQARGAARLLSHAARARPCDAEPGRPDPVAQASAHAAEGPAPGRARRPPGPHPGLHAARAARPRPLRGGLCLRIAGRGAGQPRPHLGRLRRRGAARRRQGLKDALRARRRARAARRRPLSGARATRPRVRRRRAGVVPVEVRAAPFDLRRAPPAARLGAPRRATRSPPICSREAPIYGPSRSCWAMRPSPRPRSTLE
jgi:hypothetical protein